MSHSPAKPSRPSRAYLQLSKQEYINLLSETVRHTSFVDAKGSTKDSSLLGPPSVEFAPYGRVPNGKPRKDARQGTIDQDPEFIDFLESLTNPVAKSVPVDQENESTRGKEKVTVTPLVQFLKDKKANKGKENAATKNAKQGRHDRDGKFTDTKAAVQSAQSPKKRSVQAAKVEQAARDAVKILNKQAANVKGNASTVQSSKPPTSTPSAVPKSAANNAPGQKQRERGNVSAAAKILQRDLGIGGSQRGRGARLGTLNTTGKTVAVDNQATNKSGAGASTVTPAAVPTNTTTSPTNPSVSTAGSPQNKASPPTGPAANRVPVKQPPLNSAPQKTSSKPSIPSSTSTQAFLKHANPSQGITEPLLEEAFKIFGGINKVEIDKKKGFAYVDFVEPESLQKAIKASPIKVAEGQVQVLERKTGPNLQARNNNARGASTTTGNVATGRGHTMMGSHTARGAGMTNNRGGMPVVGRGGHPRGRGGVGRGGVHMPPTDSPKDTPSASATPNTAEQPSTTTGVDSQLSGPTAAAAVNASSLVTAGT